jgi:hypothetical protein
MLRRWQAVSAVLVVISGSAAGATAVSEEPCRRFGLMSIVRSKKSNGAVGKLLLIPDAPLCHIDNPPRHHLAHSARIGGPGALASRLEEPIPGLIEGRRE